MSERVFEWVSIFVGLLLVSFFRMFMDYDWSCLMLSIGMIFYVHGIILNERRFNREQ